MNIDLKIDLAKNWFLLKYLQFTSFLENNEKSLVTFKKYTHRKKPRNKLRNK